VLFCLLSDATDRSGAIVAIVVLVLLLLILGGNFELFAANSWFEEGLFYVTFDTGSQFS
jgi:hypothetical protein